MEYFWGKQKTGDNKNESNVKLDTNTNLSSKTDSIQKQNYLLIDKFTLNELDHLRQELKEGVDFKLSKFKDELSTELDDTIKMELKKGVDWEIDNFKKELKELKELVLNNETNTYDSSLSYKYLFANLIFVGSCLYYLYKRH